MVGVRYIDPRTSTVWGVLFDITILKTADPVHLQMFIAQQYFFSTETGLIKPIGGNVTRSPWTFKQTEPDSEAFESAKRGRVKFEKYMADLERDEKASLEKEEGPKAQKINDAECNGTIRENDDEAKQRYNVAALQAKAKGLTTPPMLGAVTRAEQVWRDARWQRRQSAEDEYRWIATQAVEHLTEYAPREISPRAQKRTKGLCYLKFFERKYHWALIVIYGKRMPAKILLALSSIWKKDVTALEVVYSSKDTLHVKGSKTTSKLGSLMFILQVANWRLCGSSRPGPSRGRGRGTGRGAPGREAPKLRILGDSSKLKEALDKARKLRIDGAFNETGEPREIMTKEWMESLNKEDINVEKSLEEWTKFLSEIKEKALKEFPEDRMISGTLAREKILTLQRNFQSRWLKDCRVALRRNNQKMFVEDIFEFCERTDVNTLPGDLFRMLTKWKFLMTLETFTSLYNVTADDLGMGVMNEEFWRELVDEILSTEQSEAFSGLKINWDLEDDIRDARDIIKAMKMVSAHTPEFTRFQVAQAIMKDEEYIDQLVKYQGAELDRVLNRMSTMDTWEDMAEIMCIRPKKKREETAPTIPLSVRMVDLVKVQPDVLKETLRGTGGKAKLSFIKLPERAAEKQMLLSWYTIENMAVHGYSHFFEDPYGPMKTWSVEMAKGLYERTGYHFLVQRVANRGNACKDTSRDLLREALETELATKVNVETMGACKDWLWYTVDESTAITSKLERTALIMVNRTKALYVIRQMRPDLGVRHLFMRAANSSGVTVQNALEFIRKSIGTAYPWVPMACEKATQNSLRMVFRNCAPTETNSWPYDLPWERIPGSLHPETPFLNSGMYSKKPYECQLCYNEDHSIWKCPLVDLVIENQIMVAKSQKDWVADKTIPNSRATEGWNPEPKMQPPKPPAKRKAEDDGNEGIRKRLRVDVDTPAAPTPNLKTGRDLPRTPAVARMWRSLADQALADQVGKLNTTDDQTMALDAPPSPGTPTQRGPRGSSPQGSVFTVFPSDSDATVVERRLQTRRMLSMTYPILLHSFLDTLVSERINKSGTLARAQTLLFGTYWERACGNFMDGATEEDIEGMEQAKVTFDRNLAQKVRRPPAGGTQHTVMIE